MSFACKLTRNGVDTHLELGGHLDEGARLPAATEVGTGTLTIDLGSVQLINSLGCRRWLTWIAEVASRAEAVNLARCSFAVVQQLNMLGGFVPGRTRVASFFVPYECPRCGHGTRVLHEVGADFRSEAVPDQLTCAACGQAMTLEVMRQTYFKFLGARAS